MEVCLAIPGPDPYETANRFDDERVYKVGHEIGIDLGGLAVFEGLKEHVERHSVKCARGDERLRALWWCRHA